MPIKLSGLDNKPQLVSVIWLTWNVLVEKLKNRSNTSYVAQAFPVNTEFWVLNGSFILDTYIQKAKKSYMDSRARRNLNQLNTELQDVQRIMVQNIDDVLQRGEQLSGK